MSLTETADRFQADSGVRSLGRSGRDLRGKPACTLQELLEEALENPLLAGSIPTFRPGSERTRTRSK
jgi:hypothetical protein